MPEFNARVLQDQVVSSATIYNDLVPLRAQIDALLAAGAGATQAQLKSLPVPSSPDIVLYGNLVGRLNYWFNNQALFVPVGYKKVGNDFVPDVPPVGGLDAFRARQRVSQNCAWVLMTPQEASLLQAQLGQESYVQHTQFYTVGGSGGLGLNEQPFADSPSGYKFVQNNEWTDDVDGAADVAVAAIAAAQGRTVPPTVVV